MLPKYIKKFLNLAFTKG